ncbi:hypothetical protein NDU88_006038 [Pleurodeles waltl]|uniref:Uncharacterized protein n=1 Tax=Pleurodeles waltl TaxID=8319 RepID=A0AAV7NT24_PLEWA|nr:hypothetical protein NDU88_006038 [Pleurodeles waltl]
MMVVQEQEDYRREYLEFRIHGVLIPRGVCRGLPQVTTDDPSVESDDNATMTADEAVSISSGECRTTPIVPHARETTEETDVDNEAVNLTPGPQMDESRPL